MLGVKESVYRPIGENLHTIKAPTLIIWGKCDRIIPVDHAHVAAKRMPNALQPHLFDSCGHYPHLEQPAKFNQIVLEFLRD